MEICKICNNLHITNEFDLFDEFQMNTFLKRIFDGIVTPTRLDFDVYQRIARKLTNGVEEGFGTEIIRTQWGSPDYNMLTALRENVYVFSAARQHQMNVEVSALLTTETGLKPWSQFREEAAQVFERYNRRYLAVEYNQAVLQARAASQWMEIEKDQDIYDQLRYETVGDGRVRPQHRVLDGVIRPINDRFWTQYYPPNGWSCRCTVVQTTGERNTRLDRLVTNVLPDISETDVPKIFRFNSGKKKMIFNTNHPYFKVEKQYKQLALRNFDMELPKK